MVSCGAERASHKRDCPGQTGVAGRLPLPAQAVSAGALSAVWTLNTDTMPVRRWAWSLSETAAAVDSSTRAAFCCVI